MASRREALPVDRDRPAPYPPSGASSSETRRGALHEHLALDLCQRGEQAQEELPGGARPGVDALGERVQVDALLGQVVSEDDKPADRASGAGEFGHHDRVVGARVPEQVIPLRARHRLPAHTVVHSDAVAPGGFERVDLPSRVLVARAHPRVAEKSHRRTSISAGHPPAFCDRSTGNRHDVVPETVRSTHSGQRDSVTSSGTDAPAQPSACGLGVQVAGPCRCSVAVGSAGADNQGVIAGLPRDLPARPRDGNTGAAIHHASPRSSSLRACSLSTEMRHGPGQGVRGRRLRR